MCEKNALFFVWLFDICELQFGIVREVLLSLGFGLLSPLHTDIPSNKPSAVAFLISTKRPSAQSKNKYGESESP